MTKSYNKSKTKNKSKSIIGNSERPRLVVFRSNKHIYAQIIDDSKGSTLVSASTMNQSLKDQSSKSSTCAAASSVGEEIAQLSLSKGIRKVVFDRGQNIYHGRIKSLADSARDKGLEF
mmetsp:Transcript_26651/g.66808  ORF Transcript_26651/g.66808 Transcript_26651/m.66808 type:complete len:118 (-) Transcript_26651:590-943(-)